jgi:hypothetical protein
VFNATAQVWAVAVSVPKNNKPDNTVKTKSNFFISNVLIVIAKKECPTFKAVLSSASSPSHRQPWG